MLFCTTSKISYWAICGSIAINSALFTADDTMPDKKEPHGVVIDFSNWSVDTDVDDVTFQIEFKGVIQKPYAWKGGNGVNAGEFAEMYALNLESSGAKVELFDKTKVRVFGWEDKQGKFHPALRGAVTSKKLKPEQLPKVINPPQA